MRYGRSKLITLIVAMVCLLAAVAVAVSRSGSAFQQMSLLQDVRHEIVTGYVEEADEDDMLKSAVHAMIGSLEDPYTLYLEPEDLEPFDNQMQGRFTGIGAEITIDQKMERLRIVSPLEESPAWQSGVMAGDVVLEIDGETTAGITIREAQKRLMGPDDTQVTVKIRHDSGEEEIITITRAVINVKSVRGFRRGDENKWIYMLDPDHGIGYVKIRQFLERTPDELKQILDKLSRQNARGLILDLRFNPGGLLEAAVGVADLFLEDQQTIVSIKGRRVARQVETATSVEKFALVPIVVLANEASASAAEIVTGALTDNKRAKFIGMRTYGKGSVQGLRMFKSGRGAIKITTAHYFLPSGRLIHKREDSEVWGVDPEDGFFVPTTTEQLDRMRDIQLENKVLRHHNEAITPQWLEEDLADLQLAAALEAMLGKLETDQWPVIGEAGAQLLARQSRRQELKRRRDFLVERLQEVKDELTELEKEIDEPAESAPVTP